MSNARKPESLKLLFLSTETRPIIGGVAQALDGWLTGLAEIGHDVCILALLPLSVVQKRASLPPRPYAERWVGLPERNENILDSFLPLRKIRSALYLLRRRRVVVRAFEEAVSQFAPDRVIFCAMNQVCCLPLSIAKKKNLKCVGIVYGSEIHPKRVTESEWLRRTLASMERIIAISEFTKELAAGWNVPRERIAIVHPALTSDAMNGEALQQANLAPRNYSTRRTHRFGKLSVSSKSLSSKERDLLNLRASPPFSCHEKGTGDEFGTTRQAKFKLLTISRLVERKGVQTVLEAIAGLKKLNGSVEYHIVGEGPFRSALEQRAKELALNGQVFFHGNVSNEKRELLIAESDIFVMTPHETDSGDVEGFGIVYLEAGVYGKPVIGSRSGGVSGAVLDGETGVLVEPENATALRDTFAQLIDDKEMRRKLGAKGKEWALEHAPAAIAMKLEKVLARC